MQNRYFSDKALAERFGVTRGTIWAWVRKSDFPKPVRLSAKCTRWPAEAIETWEQNQGVQP